MGFPKLRGTFLGVPVIRIIVYWGLWWGRVANPRSKAQTPKPIPTGSPIRPKKIRRTLLVSLWPGSPAPFTLNGGFLKLGGGRGEGGGYHFRVPIIRSIVLWGLYWGPRYPKPKTLQAKP